MRFMLFTQAHAKAAIEKFGADSACYWMEQTVARPKIGRPLHNLPSTMLGGFLAAVPSRAFRDGTGVFMVKLGDYPKFPQPRVAVLPRTA